MRSAAAASVGGVHDYQFSRWPLWRKVEFGFYIGFVTVLCVYMLARTHRFAAEHVGELLATNVHYDRVSADGSILVSATNAVAKTLGYRGGRNGNGEGKRNDGDHFIFAYDNTDIQWRDFSKQLGVAVVTLLGMAALVRWARRAQAAAVRQLSAAAPVVASGGGGAPGGGASELSTPPLFYRRTVFVQCAFNLIFFVYLHGLVNGLIPLLVLLVNYYCVAPLHRCLPRGSRSGTVYLLIFWTFHAAVLYVNGWLSMDRPPPPSNSTYDVVTHLTHQRLCDWLQQWFPSFIVHSSLYGNLASGVLRYTVVFNMHTLRMISFNYDYWEASQPDAVLKRARAREKALLMGPGASDNPSSSSSSSSQQPPSSRLPSSDSCGGPSSNGAYRTTSPSSPGAAASPASPPSLGDFVNGTAASPTLVLPATPAVTTTARSASPGIDVLPDDRYTYKHRTQYPRRVAEYESLSHYLAYCLYSPLLIAGPITTFNSYMSGVVEVPQTTFDLRSGTKYLLRIAARYLVLTWMLYVTPVNVVRRNDDLFARMSAGEKAGVMYLTLAFLWLKFSIIWRTFRLLAAVEGTDAPEDMNRCFSDTVTVSDFWKDWHASFNLWIVRYMYVPLGGSKLRLFAVVPIFIFIAFWHDNELKLFGWAIVMLIAFIPEIVATAYLSHPRFNELKQRPAYRYLQAIGGTFSTTGLVLANCVGYGTGVSQSASGVSDMLTAENAATAVVSIVFIYCAAQIGLYQRAHHHHHNTLATMRATKDEMRASPATKRPVTT